MARKAAIDESSMFPESKLPIPTPEQAAKLSSLSKTKDEFGKAVLGFRAVLQDQTLLAQRTQTQKDRQNNIIRDLNTYAGDLEDLNSGEGIFSLAIIALNSILTLRDDINDLRFQNLMLHKRIKELNSVSKIESEA